MKTKRSHLSIGLLILILSLTVTGAINQSFKSHYKLRTPKSSAGEISIVTPENKTYTEPDIGYYPATYGFENDEDDTIPNGWGYRLTIPQGDSYIKIIPSLDGHEKVLDLNKGNTYGSHLHTWHNFSDQEFGTIEFWLRTTDVTEATEFILRNRNNDASFCAIGVGGQGLGSNFTIFTSGGWQSLPYPANNNKWYHIRFQFECGTGNHYGLDQFFFRLYIDGLEIGNFSFYSNQPKADQIVILQNWLYENYHSYFDAISFSWDQNYNIGDNLNEGLLLSYDNTTTLDWQGFSLDGQENKTIGGNTAIPLPIDGFHSIQLFGNDSIGTMYESNVRYFSVNAATSIGIITPENITYTVPMSGYYPATYGFENDKIGNIPEEWSDESPYSSCSISVYDQKDQHKQIVQIYDANTGTGADATAQYNFESPKVTGIIECWVYKESGDCALIIQGIDDTNAGFQISIDAENNGVFRYSSAPSTYVEFATGKYSDQKWFHLRIDFNCDTDTIDIYVNGIKEVDDGPFYLPVPDISFILIRSGHSGRSGILYFDAVGLSWDASYNNGENLNEGLLLSYSNNTNMEWVGYSLDGSPNITITGNKVIPFPEIGIHSLILNGITSIGMSTKSELRYFTISTQDPPIQPEIPSPFPIIPIILASIGIGIIALLSITIILLRRRIPRRTSSTIISREKSQ